MELLTQSNFLRLLFNEGEHTTFTAFAKGHLSTRVYPAHSEPSFDSQYFCINPLNGQKDCSPTQPWHAADKPRRADANVTSYRNFLIESDETPLEQQLELFKKTGCPVSAIVFSGGKSYHFFISLKTPLADEKEYRLTHQLICAALKNASAGAFKADATTKNPSRLGRLGNAIRSNGEVQSILLLGERIEPGFLKEWVTRHAQDEVAKLTAQKKSIQKTNEAIDYLIARYGGEPSDYLPKNNMLPAYVAKFLTEGAATGERNSTLFKAACALAEAGQDEDEIYSQAAAVLDLPGREIRQTIKSAVNKVGR